MAEQSELPAQGTPTVLDAARDVFCKVDKVATAVPFMEFTNQDSDAFLEEVVATATQCAKEDPETIKELEEEYGLRKLLIVCVECDGLVKICVLNQNAPDSKARQDPSVHLRACKCNRDDIQGLKKLRDWQAKLDAFNKTGHIDPADRRLCDARARETINPNIRRPRALNRRAPQMFRELHALRKPADPKVKIAKPSAGPASSPIASTEFNAILKSGLPLAKIVKLVLMEKEGIIKDKEPQFHYLFHLLKAAAFRDYAITAKHVLVCRCGDCVQCPGVEHHQGEDAWDIRLDLAELDRQYRPSKCMCKEKSPGRFAGAEEMEEKFIHQDEIKKSTSVINATPPVLAEKMELSVTGPRSASSGFVPASSDSINDISGTVTPTYHEIGARSIVIAASSNSGVVATDDTIENTTGDRDNQLLLHGSLDKAAPESSSSAGPPAGHCGFTSALDGMTTKAPLLGCEDQSTFSSREESLNAQAMALARLAARGNKRKAEQELGTTEGSKATNKKAKSGEGIDHVIV